MNSSFSSISFDAETAIKFKKLAKDFSDKGFITTSFEMKWQQNLEAEKEQTIN